MGDYTPDSQGLGVTNPPRFIAWTRNGPTGPITVGRTYPERSRRGSRRPIRAAALNEAHPQNSAYSAINAFRSPLEPFASAYCCTTPIPPPIALEWLSYGSLDCIRRRDRRSRRKPLSPRCRRNPSRKHRRRLCADCRSIQSDRSSVRNSRTRAARPRHPENRTACARAEASSVRT